MRSVEKVLDAVDRFDREKCGDLDKKFDSLVEKGEDASSKGYEKVRITVSPAVEKVNTTVVVPVVEATKKGYESTNEILNRLAGQAKTIVTNENRSQVLNDLLAESKKRAAQVRAKLSSK